jgi:hypothetical protein
MSFVKRSAFWLPCFAFIIGVATLCINFHEAGSAEPPPSADSKTDYSNIVRPLLVKYCLDCHSTKIKKGELDLERFGSFDLARQDLKPWQALIEQLEAGEMPPKEKPQPSAEERKRLVGWARGFLDAEARARAGDPGPARLRRLSHAEYTYTVRDLTGVDLQPAREFPADGAAGEGFTNAAEALSMSPALVDKYLAAAKEIADHAVLLPDGFRFSPAKTRHDWTNEETAKLRQFYSAYATGDGRLQAQPYLAAAVRHRDELLAGKATPEAVATREKLNANYFGELWRTLNDKSSSEPLDAIRAKWRTAAEKDVPGLAAEIAQWQAVLWKTVRVGSYVQESWGANAAAPKGYADSLTRAVPVVPPAAESVPLRVTIKPAPGQNEVVLYLAARELAGSGARIAWQRPRFEAVGKPALLLRDYAEFGAAFEVDYPSAFAKSAKYLTAAVELANDKKRTVEDAAKEHGLDAIFLKRWSEVLAIAPFAKDTDEIGRIVPAAPLTLLEEKTPKNDAKPAINGWRKKGTDLPVLVTNSSDKVEQIPGRIPAKGVGVHPMPKEFVAVVWTSPVTGAIRVEAKVTHAHPACGNGVAWWLEHRRGNRAAVFAEGAVDLGGEAIAPKKTLKVEKGDQIILVVDAKDENHVCDMTAIEFSLFETEKPGRVWNLAADIATSVLDGNPHADSHGNKDVWSFVRGPTRPLGKSISSIIPHASLLGKWREAASDPMRKDEATKLAEQVQAVLSGKRPAQEKSPDRVLYDNLVAVEGPLFVGVDITKLARRSAIVYGLPKEKFTDSNLVASANAVTEIKLPAALFAGREFVVQAKLDGATTDGVVQVRAAADRPNATTRWDGPVLASSHGAGYKRLLAGYAEFRRIFPLFICFPQVVPTDEVVCLKMFHREDEPLIRMFLDEKEAARLEHLWVEHRFISRQPVAENDYLPQFMAYTTQDTPKDFQQFFVDRKPRFQKRADEFRAEEETAVPKQLDALLAFAARAYRRPLLEKEKAELLGLYQSLRKKNASPGEAFRGALARVLVSPAFLFKLEQPAAGKEPKPINDWELAARLSYFLWSSAPDDELRRNAADGKLHEPKVLAEQTQRMLKDPKLRALAIEFGTQWLHVRGFDELKEKNEKLFPMFDDKLRKAIYEESILFFEDLFQNERPVANILDADYTFLNETLAKHYGIPGVAGENWRKVDSVKKYGRGGILGLASIQTKESGASRTSPVLRGNWVVETLLGEKLPKPPPNVPRLPEEESGNDGLTMRQLVEKHTRIESCAVCHVRIDPYGFAFEKYDPIGRLRDKDLGGLPVDAKAKLKDGIEFEGIDGLRNYLVTKKKDVIVKLFCRKLVGYALGRRVILSDQALIDEMVVELKKNDGRIATAVLAIVRSPQFRMIRGSEFAE